MGQPTVLFKEVAELLWEPDSSEMLQALWKKTSTDVASRHALLSMLFPQHERRFVYKRKTFKLLELWKEAYKPFPQPNKRIDLVREYREWLDSPTPKAYCTGNRCCFYCKPEDMVAEVHTKLGYSSFSRLSLLEMQALRQALSASSPERQQASMVLATKLPSLGMLEIRALFLILLRCVSTHILLHRVNPDARTFLCYRNDLEKLAQWSMLARPEASLQLASLEWGVPSRPMLSDNVGHHYLLPWQFKSAMPDKQLQPKNLHIAFVPDASGKIQWWFGVWRRQTIATGASGDARGDVDIVVDEDIDIDDDISEISDEDDEDYKPTRQAPKRKAKRTSNTKQSTKVVQKESRKQSNNTKQSSRKAKKSVYKFILLDDEVGMKESHKAVIALTKEFRDTRILQEGKLSGHALRYTLFSSNDKTNHVMQMVNVVALNEEYVNARSLPLYTSAPTSLVNLDECMLPPYTVGAYTVAVEAPSKQEEDSIMVQTKYDGDRLQAHIKMSDKGTIEIKLFTKNGYDFTEQYSDVSNGLQNHYRRHRTILPCILDGELIVASADTNKPMAWEQGKWKYNTGEQCVGDADVEKIFVLMTGDAADGDSDDDDVTFLAPKSRPPHLRESKGVALQDKGYLQFVVFDLLMHKGEACLRQPYIQRYTHLQQDHHLAFVGSNKYIKLAESGTCRTCAEIQDKLLTCVRDRTEGLMLKNPKGLLSPGKRSADVVKLKITGPDINTYVVGAGYNLSGNPRQWGILTAVMMRKTVSTEEEGVVYVRVQSFDGDQQPRIIYSVYSMASKIRVADLKLLHQKKKSEFVLHTASGDDVSVVQREGGDCTVTWTKHPSFTLHIQDPRQLHDVQWLVNPLECAFGLSVRGDLRALKEYGNHLLRFPVGRVEFANVQQSKVDTVEEVGQKFTDAQATEKCIDGFTERYARKLRKWGTKEHIRDLSRLAHANENEVSLGSKVQKKYNAQTVRTFLAEIDAPPLTVAEQETLEKGVHPPSQWLQQGVVQELLASEQEARDKARQEERAIFSTAHKKQLESTLQRLHALWAHKNWRLVTTSGRFSAPPPTSTSVTNDEENSEDEDSEDEDSEDKNSEDKNSEDENSEDEDNSYEDYEGEVMKT